jgi:ferric-dicitrate binding protein FerR (iron transport regulator)
MGVFCLYGLYQVTDFGEQNISSTYHTVKAPHGAKAEITLADGTNIVLNSGSELTYPEFFVADKREVKLSGEAYFDVERDEERPFIIKTKDIKVKVLGTSFNVKAYPEDETVETFVESGKVEVELTNVSVQQKKIFLTRNEKAVFTKGTNQLAVEDDSSNEDIAEPKIDNVPVVKRKPQLLISVDNNSEEELAWKEERFIFKNEPMESLIIKLERWYGVDIELNKKGLTEYHFTGTFERETIEEVMNVIAFSIPIRWKKEHKKILIYSKN